MASERFIHPVSQTRLPGAARRDRWKIRSSDTSCKLQIAARSLLLPTVPGTVFFFLVPVSMVMHQSLVSVSAGEGRAQSRCNYALAGAERDSTRPPARAAAARRGRCHHRPRPPSRL